MYQALSFRAEYQAKYKPNAFRSNELRPLFQVTKSLAISKERRRIYNHTIYHINWMLPQVCGIMILQFKNAHFWLKNSPQRVNFRRVTWGTTWPLHFEFASYTSICISLAASVCTALIRRRLSKQGTFTSLNYFCHPLLIALGHTICNFAQSFVVTKWQENASCIYQGRCFRDAAETII